MKIVTVVGARPQFIKAAAVSRAVLARSGSGLVEVLVHTGQHYDKMMSDVFFEELGINAPAHNLAIAGGGHGAMTGRMLEALERVFIDERPDWVLIYGDTNSTLAAALAASKLHIPIAHVEAGLRSFNMRMPEEVNRIVADRLSTLLLCPTEASISNLRREGVTDGVHLVGDVMYDVALHFAHAADEHHALLSQLGLRPKGFVLATCHRAETTDDPAQLAGVVDGLADIARHQPVVLPIHPRTRAKLTEFGLMDRLAGVQLIEPVSYLDMVTLEKNAAVIVTDSGGIQKEAFFYRVPCVTTRRETEWVETVDAGWNVLVGTDSKAMVAAVESHASQQRFDVQPYGDGDAANRILDLLRVHPAATRRQ
ncbi:MAG: non-hydrolyzing UDP-N-acetylglucosamine 2-epimerase [Roseateles sp.]|uniref:non-hydrolyzing UDP-N-acetylglucosamine 2-epimerase n=1 Tax=Roseateles sp. TaxID=1971397 RepID=UPI0040365FA5